MAVEARTIRVLIADDQTLFRSGLARLLGEDPRITICGQAVDGQDAVAKSAALKPDVILMDLKMPSMDGVEATAKIVAAQPGVKVLILTTFDTDSFVLQALRAGASGYVLKDAEPAAIASSIAIWVARGSCSPVRRPSTTRTPRSGVITRSVQPLEAIEFPSRSTELSSARTTVVPTAMTRPPLALAARTRSAVRSGTSYHSSYGCSCPSRLATPACRTSLARPIPWLRRHASIDRVNARPAEGISADPSSRAYTV